MANRQIRKKISFTKGNKDLCNKKKNIRLIPLDYPFRYRNANVKRNCYIPTSQMLRPGHFRNPEVNSVY